MMVRELICLLLFLCCVYSIDVKVFQSYSLAARNESRKQVVQSTLKQVAGVYLDKNKGKSLGLDSTVFMSVASFNPHHGVGHYKVYLRNFQCFMQHYQIDHLLYMVHHGIDSIDKEVASLESQGSRVLSYPDELFWQIVSERKTGNTLKTGRGYADYAGSTPSFSSFGALVMLVPVLEVLLLGYNVIFFDVDIGLVQDPVPFLTRSRADLVSSLESRYCPLYSPSPPDHLHHWATAEPNTGVMHVRATPRGKALFRSWLGLIVDTNVMNDQRAMDRNALKARYVTDCVDSSSSGSSTSTSSGSEGPTVCFLSDVLFQNGMVAVQCPIKPAMRDDWFLALYHQGTPLNVSSSSSAGGGSNSVVGRFPVTMHANYCKAKTHELQVRGLWLLRENSSAPDGYQCVLPYDIGNTYYATSVKWEQEVAEIRDRREQLSASLMNGTAIQCSGAQEVYLLLMEGQPGRERSRRRIPDKDTFEAMFGENWGAIRQIPSEVFLNITEGPPLPSLAST